LAQVELSPDLGTFRSSIIEWIAANAPAGLAHRVDWDAPEESRAAETIAKMRTSPEYLEWEQKLVDAHMVCPHWPVEYGGSGWDVARLAIFVEEFDRAGVPRVRRGMGEMLVGPSILAWASHEQKARLIPRIIKGVDVYCQGFSEPGSGSDLASIATRGVVDGEDLVITGQKIWTSGAMTANRMFVLCRTDPDAPRHKGLSYALCDMSGAAVDVRPIRQINGASHFAEVFLDGVRTPLSEVIGNLGDGWQVAMSTLGFERSEDAETQYLPYERYFWTLVEALKEAGRESDPVIRQALAWAHTHVQILRFQGLRTMSEALSGEPPGPGAYTHKLFWSEFEKAFGEKALTVLGAAGLLRPQSDVDYAVTELQDLMLYGRSATIYAGTSEIQRNIIAERALGLPREAR
jgi:alkylation response protein AidB-like acyl-CoA dehydrogenase